MQVTISPLLFSMLIFSSFSFASLAAVKKPAAFLTMLDTGKHPLAISARGVQQHSDVRNAHMFPRGAAVLTQSGNLEKVGIKQIIHAAPGAMGKSGVNFAPTVKGLRLSVKNAIWLAEKMKLNCLAIPFIGGGIFHGAMGVSKEKLAGEIVDAAVATKTKTRVIFVPFGADDTAIFKKIMQPPASGIRGILTRHIPAHFTLAPGSLVDFQIHKCETIVNAANMELHFGGGLSGRIGDATGQAAAINAAAQILLKKYYGE